MRERNERGEKERKGVRERREEKREGVGGERTKGRGREREKGNEPEKKAKQRCRNSGQTKWCDGAILKKPDNTEVNGR